MENRRVADRIFLICQLVSKCHWVQISFWYLKKKSNQSNKLILYHPLKINHPLSNKCWNILPVDLNFNHCIWPRLDSSIITRILWCITNKFSCMGLWVIFDMVIQPWNYDINSHDVESSRLFVYNLQSLMMDVLVDFNTPSNVGPCPRWSGLAVSNVSSSGQGTWPQGVPGFKKKNSAGAFIMENPTSARSQVGVLYKSKKYNQYKVCIFCITHHRDACRVQGRSREGHPLWCTRACLTGSL